MDHINHRTVFIEIARKPDFAHSGGWRYVRSVDWQQPTALAIVALTAGVFAWRRLKPRAFDFSRDTHCGCAGASNPNARASVTFHARKDGSRQIKVKIS